jgi:hypothetical protein
MRRRAQIDIDIIEKNSFGMGTFREWPKQRSIIIYSIIMNLEWILFFITFYQSKGLTNHVDGVQLSLNCGHERAYCSSPR